MAITTCPFNWFDKGIRHLDLDTILADDIRVILVASGYAPNSATHEFYDVDITNELPTASGYTSGGLALTTKTLTTVVAGEWKFKSDNPVWTIADVDLTSHLFVLYNNTPVSNKPLIGFGYLNWNGGDPQGVTTVVGSNQTILLPSGCWFKTTKVNGS